MIQVLERSLAHVVILSTLVIQEDVKSKTYVTRITAKTHVVLAKLNVFVYPTFFSHLY